MQLFNLERVSEINKKLICFLVTASLLSNTSVFASTTVTEESTDKNAFSSITSFIGDIKDAITGKFDEWFKLEEEKAIVVEEEKKLAKDAASIDDYLSQVRLVMESNYKLANKALTADDYKNLSLAYALSNFSKPFKESFQDTVIRIKETTETEGSTVISDSYVTLVSNSQQSLLYFKNGEDYSVATLGDFLIPYNNKVTKLYKKVKVQDANGEKAYSYQTVFDYSTSNLIYLDMLLNATDSSDRNYIKQELNNQIGIDSFGNILMMGSETIVYPVCLNGNITNTKNGKFRVGTLLFAQDLLKFDDQTFQEDSYKFNLKSDSDYDVSIFNSFTDKTIKRFSPFNITSYDMNGKNTKVDGWYLMGTSSREDILGKYSLNDVSNRDTYSMYIGGVMFSLSNSMGTYVQRTLPTSADYRLCYEGSFATEKFFTPTIAYGSDSDEDIVNLFLSASDLDLKLGNEDIFEELTVTYQTKVGSVNELVDYTYLKSKSVTFDLLAVDQKRPGVTTKMVAALQVFADYYLGVKANSVSVKTNPIVYDLDIFETGKSLTGADLPAYKTDGLTLESLNMLTVEEFTGACKTTFNPLQSVAEITDADSGKFNGYYDFYLNSFYSEKGQMYLSSGVVTAEDEVEVERSQKQKVMNIIDAIHSFVTDFSSNIVNMIMSTVSMIHVTLSKVDSVEYIMHSRDMIVKMPVYLALLRFYVFLILVAATFRVFGAVFTALQGKATVKDLVRDTVKIALLFTLPYLFFVSYLAIADFYPTKIFNQTLIRWASIDIESAIQSHYDDATSQVETEAYFLSYKDRAVSEELVGSSFKYVYYDDYGTLQESLVRLKGASSGFNGDYTEGINVLYKEDINDVTSGFEFKTPNYDLYDDSLYFYFYDNFMNQMKLYYKDTSINSVENGKSPTYVTQDKFLQMITDPNYTQFNLDGDVQDILGLGRLFYKDESITNNMIDVLSTSAWYGELLKSPKVGMSQFRSSSVDKLNIDALNYPDNIMYASKVNAPYGTVLSVFELAMCEANNAAYSKMIKLSKYEGLSDETVIRLSSAIALFEFNKVMSGDSPLGFKLTPTVLNSDGVNLDTVIRSCFAVSVEDMGLNTNIVKYINDVGTWIPVLLLPLLDAIVALSGIFTITTLICVLSLTLFSFIYNHMFLKRSDAKLAWGLTLVYVALALIRIVLVTCFNVLSSSELLSGGKATDIYGCLLIMIALIVLFGAYLWANVMGLRFLLKHWKDLGSVVAMNLVSKLTQMSSNLIQSNVGTVESEAESIGVNSNMSEINSGSSKAELSNAQVLLSDKLDVVNEKDLEEDDLEESSLSTDVDKVEEKSEGA